MKKGVVIGTSEYTKDFLKPLLDSIKGVQYDILVVSNGGYKPDVDDYFCGDGKDCDCTYTFDLIVNDWNGWELAVVQRGKETFDEFVHIMDTTLIKDISLFDKLFAIEGNVVLTKGNFHYMGKFVTKELPNLPRVHDKTTAIMLETKWLDGYKYTEFVPDLPVHSNKWIEIHGQRRMVISNQYMTKFKGTVWISESQLAELTEQEKQKLNKETSSK